MRTFLLLLLAVFGTSRSAQAQAVPTESPRLAFEVATVKLAPSDGPGGIILTPADFRLHVAAGAARPEAAGGEDTHEDMGGGTCGATDGKLAIHRLADSRPVMGFAPR